MEYDPKDNEVIHLLKKLKEANGGAYPQEMLALRRQGYLKQVAEISGAAGLSMGLKDLAENGKGPGIAPTAGTVVETLLVIAIVAEAGAVAYFYRDKVMEFFRSSTVEPRIEPCSNPPVLPSLIAEIGITPSPVFTVTGTDTLTPVGTPSLEWAAGSTQPGETGSSSSPGGDGSGPGAGTSTGTSGGSGTSLSTPEPNPTNDNNGNQYGLTPKPDRTKEPGNDVSDDNTQDSTANPKKNK